MHKKVCITGNVINYPTKKDTGLNTNNQTGVTNISQKFIFEKAEKCLLFPGDAQ